MNVSQPDIHQVPARNQATSSAVPGEPARAAGVHALLQRGATLVRTVSIRGTSSAPELPRPSESQSWRVASIQETSPPQIKLMLIDESTMSDVSNHDDRDRVHDDRWGLPAPALNRNLFQWKQLAGALSVSQYG